MKLIARLELTDDTRRGIRAAAGKSGLATKAECSKWIAGLVAGADLPEPKRRRKEPIDPGPEDTTHGTIEDDAEPSIDAQFGSVEARRFRFEAAAAAEPGSVCRLCGRTKEQHGKMGFTCPPVEGTKRGAIFEAVEA